MTTIVTKNGSGAPLASDLVQGELAVDLTNKRLYTEDSGGSVIEVGTNPTELTVTGDLTVDTDTLFVDASGDKVAINDATGRNSTLHVNSGLLSSSIGLSASGTTTKDNQALVCSGDDLYFTTGGSERMRIDSSGNVGIGTASPSYKLDVQGTARVTTGSTGTPFIVESGGTSQGNIRFGSASLEYGIYGGADYLSMQFHAGGSEAMRIDSSGNVGIGTSSPNASLHISQNPPVLALGSTGSSDPRLDFYDQGTTTVGASMFLDQSEDMLCLLRTASGNATDGIRIDSSGNVGIGNSNPSAFNTLGATDKLVIGDSTISNLTLFGTQYGSLAFADSDTSSSTAQYAGLIQYYHPDNSMAFYTTSTESMRIDSSGNLLVGMTSYSASSVGTTMQSGLLTSARDGNIAGYFNRLSSDGSIVAFAKDGTTVGSIGVANSNNLYIQGDSTETGLQFGTSVILPHQGGFEVDNIVDFGSSTKRFKDLYLSGNVRAGTTSLSGRLQASQSTNGTLVSYLQHTGSDPYGLNIDFNVSNPNNTTNYFVRGEDASAVEFHIWSDGSFVQASDRRLKDNIVDSGPALETVSSIQVREFDKGETHHSHGFIAQELAEVYPEVTVPPREEDGDKGTWGVNYQRMVPMLVKAIQEQQVMIEELKAEVAALKGA